MGVWWLFSGESSYVTEFAVTQSWLTRRTACRGGDLGGANSHPQPHLNLDNFLVDDHYDVPYNLTSYMTGLIG